MGDAFFRRRRKTLLGADKQLSYSDVREQVQVRGGYAQNTFAEKTGCKALLSMSR
jgi:hypothetical protein